MAAKIFDKFNVEKDINLHSKLQHPVLHKRIRCLESLLYKSHKTPQNLAIKRELCIASLHSMAIANTNKKEFFLTNTTTASKYIPKRPRICIN